MRLADGTEVQLLVDVWEGSLDIDEGELQEAGVVGIIPRLNAITGGLRKDKGFDAQWAQAAGFVRFPYPVHTPWKTPKENFDFLCDTVPDGVRRIMIDKEVQRDDQDASREAGDFMTFIELCKTRWAPCIYTGPWFLPYLSAWPVGLDYVWARYPYSVYPEQSQIITWATLKSKLAQLTWNPDPVQKARGPIRIWQCTADRYKLPGCAGRAIDICLWKGTVEELRAWVGEEQVGPVALTREQQLDRLWAAHPELHP